VLQSLLGGLKGPKVPPPSFLTQIFIKFALPLKPLPLPKHSGRVDMAAVTQTDNMDSSHIEKPSSQVLQVEDLKTMDTLENLVYNDTEEEPELHARTYIALLAMFILNLVQVVALQGPPAVVCSLNL
jgi:hypothetical protein